MKKRDIFRLEGSRPVVRISIDFDLSAHPGGNVCAYRAKETIGLIEWKLNNEGIEIIEFQIHAGFRTYHGIKLVDVLEKWGRVLDVRSLHGTVSVSPMLNGLFQTVFQQSGFEIVEAGAGKRKVQKNI